MKSVDFKALGPYLAAIVIFLLISLVYFNPLLEGMKLNQADTLSNIGASKEIKDHRKAYDEEPLWTNSMFSGMPAYQIATQYKGNKITFVDKYLRLGIPRQASFLFISLLGFFVLLRTLKVDKWLSIAGAIAFAFSSYFFIILEAGHNSKAHAIAYMAPVIAGIMVTFRGRLLAGGVLTAMSIALLMKAGHPQITYYLMFLVLIIGIAEFISSVTGKRLIPFLKSAIVLLLAAGIAFSTNITSILTTLEYGEYSIRGKTELSTEKENRTSGLDKDYALDWSYGISESLTLLVPDFKGGSSQEELGPESNLYQFLASNNPNLRRQQSISASLYWGGQPFTSGPVYAGAIIIFLFVLGLVLVRGNLKWALLLATILSLMLAWGKYLMPLSDLFLEYVPGYNKFRAVAMILVIAQVTIPMLGFLGLNEFLDKTVDIRKKVKALYFAGGTVAGLLLVILLFSGGYGYEGPKDVDLQQNIVQQITQQGNTEMVALDFADQYVDNLQEDRKAALRSDALRSLLFVALAFVLLWLYLKKSLRIGYVLAILPVLIIVDMWGISRRYLNEESYVRKREFEKVFTQTEADRVILKDKDPYYRVLNLATNTFNESTTSYWHKSVGGYHGAKLRRYQELIEAHIATMNIAVLNMLNTKYIINRGQDGRPVVIPNTQALGNAWFVESYRIVENADSEITALSNFDPSRLAFIDQRFSEQLEGYENGIDSLGGILLTEYRANMLKFRYNTSKDQLAVFSDIYYPKGWNAYVDGELHPHFRTNFVLRGMILPAGSGELEFRFEPRTYATGELISLISSWLLILLAAGSIGFWIYRIMRPKA